MPRNLVRFSGVISVFVIILDNILVLSAVKLKMVFGQLEIVLLQAKIGNVLHFRLEG